MDRMLASGCDRHASLGCEATTIRMGVASSLRELSEVVLADLERTHPALSVTATFGASSILARQLAMGAPLDLLVSADPDLLDELIRDGLIEADSIAEIARGRLVLAARPGFQPSSPDPGQKSGKAPEDPIDSSIRRFGLPGEAVPLGRYGRAWLRNRNLLATLQGKVVVTENARANLRALEAGHVDLALLYASDALSASTLQVIHAPDPKRYPAIRYVAGLATNRAACLGPGSVLKAWKTQALHEALDRYGFERPQ